MINQIDNQTKDIRRECSGDIECWNCGKKGHTQWYCKKKDDSSKTDPRAVKKDAPKQ